MQEARQSVGARAVRSGGEGLYGRPWLGRRSSSTKMGARGTGRGRPSRTLLGNFVEMSGQEEHDPFKWNKRSGRSMRGQNQRLHQEGMGSRTASHAVHTPPIHPLFSLFSCPYKISQQSHLSCTWPIDRPCVDVPISRLFCSCSLSSQPCDAYLMPGRRFPGITG